MLNDVYWAPLFDPKVFCLLQVKCPVIGRDVGASVAEIVVRQSRPDGA